jgi:hypothetical protein
VFTRKFKKILKHFGISFKILVFTSNKVFLEWSFGNIKLMHQLFFGNTSTLASNGAFLN